MNTLVQPVDAQQKSQMISLVFQEFFVLRFRFPFTCVEAIDLRAIINATQPVRKLCFDFLHLCPIRAEQDVFPVPFQIA